MFESIFSLCDLAGAERPGTTGGKRVSGMEAMMEMMQGKEVSVGCQGLFVNYELFEVGKEVVKATDLHKRGLPYKAMTQLTPPIAQYLASYFQGNAQLGMIVCVSQAPQCGWETWFSMEYATNLAKIRAPARPAKPKNFVQLINQVQADLKKMTDETKVVPTPGTSQAKFYPRRIAMKTNLKGYLTKLKYLKTRL